MTRQRIANSASIETSWGETIGEDRSRAASVNKEAKAPSGLYDFPRAIQTACESSTRKLKKAAISMIRTAYEKDRRVVEFLLTHSKRAKSSSARILLAAFKEAFPVLSSMGVRGGKPVEAGKTKYGLYGYPSKVANLGLSACMRLREAAGEISADLHYRKAAEAERILGFLQTHSKKARCGYSKLLHRAYPDPQMRLASTKAIPKVPVTVDDWINWEPE